VFEVGSVYDRRRDIHGPYGGSWQSGIAPSREWPLVFLFTGQSGAQYGYEDEWDENGVFHYTGEGQSGDMNFERGNRAVRDHVKDGRDLHLFEDQGKGEGYRYLGRFACSTWENRRGLDRNEDERWIIVFHLVSAEGDQPYEKLDESTASSVGQVSLEQLRERAFESASDAGENDPRESRRLYRKRSAAVREYVLARAGGTCESCGNPAPFERPDGTPYLEPHHIRKLSDGGPDHPRWVGAICPNCHQEMHHGAGRAKKNDDLEQYLASLEKSAQ
jgi:5-methylcytosine-specific restriction enzyme A